MARNHAGVILYRRLDARRTHRGPAHLQSEQHLRNRFEIERSAAPVSTRADDVLDAIADDGLEDAGAIFDVEKHVGLSGSFNESITLRGVEVLDLTYFTHFASFLYLLFEMGGAASVQHGAAEGNAGREGATQ